MLEFSTFFFAVVGSINMFVMIRRFKLRDVITISILCIIYIYSRHFILQYTNYLLAIENYEVEMISGQNDEKIIGMENLQNLPVKAYENTYYIAVRNNNTIVLDGDCVVEDEVKFGTYMTEKISSNFTEKTLLEFPYIYYPGYVIKFDGVELDAIETENGFLGCYIPSYESGKIEISYNGTDIMIFSKLVSIIGFCVFAIYVMKKY